MKNKYGMILATALVSFTLAGCTLDRNVPKASITYNPVSKTFDIKSHKDIEMTNLVYTVATNGTVTLSIGNYEAKANVDVIRAAVEAQQQQIKGSLEALNQILQAAGASKTLVK